MKAIFLFLLVILAVVIVASPGLSVAVASVLRVVSVLGAL